MLQKSTKRAYKIILFIEIQAILALLIWVAVKTNTIDKRVYDSGKFMYELLGEKRLKELNTIKEKDIVIGDANAPLTMFIYTKLDCSACNDFFTTNYPLLKQEFIENGILKVVIRYQVHISQQEGLYAAQCAYLAHQHQMFDVFNQRLEEDFPSLDSVFVNHCLYEAIQIENQELNNTDKDFLLSTALQAREAGIRLTPIFYLNGKRIIGNRKYEYFQETLYNELNDLTCE